MKKCSTKLAVSFKTHKLQYSASTMRRQVIIYCLFMYWYFFSIQQKQVLIYCWFFLCRKSNTIKLKHKALSFVHKAATHASKEIATALRGFYCLRCRWDKCFVTGLAWINTNIIFYNNAWQGVSVDSLWNNVYITIVLSTVFYDKWVNDINNLSQTEIRSVDGKHCIIKTFQCFV